MGCGGPHTAGQATAGKEHQPDSPERIPTRDAMQSNPAQGSPGQSLARCSRVGEPAGEAGCDELPELVVAHLAAGVAIHTEVLQGAAGSRQV